jgi:hypothetical protein
MFSIYNIPSINTGLSNGVNHLFFPSFHPDEFLTKNHKESREFFCRSNPSVLGVFIPLWQRGIKGDFKIMLVKSPLAPLCQRGV